MSQQLNLAIFCHFLSSERSFCLGCHDRHGSSGVARWTCSWGPTLVLGPQKRGGRQKVPSKSTGTHKEICNLLDSITLQLTVRPCQIGLGRCVSTKNCFFFAGSESMLIYQRVDLLILAKHQQICEATLHCYSTNRWSIETPKAEMTL